MHDKVERLLNKKQYEQRTQDWYDIRRSLITASSAACLLKKDSKTCDPYINEYKLNDIFDKNNKCCNPYSSKNKFILDKCKQGTFTGNIATYWGQKYESVVTDIYSNKYNVEVLEFGLLIHDTEHHLGASPDGITTEGVMIEIKCPFRRKITGIPPFYYWIQVQLQLEICDLMYCDFVEYEFTEFETEEEFLDDNTLDLKILNKGIYIQVYTPENNSDNPINDPSKSTYIYPPKNILDNVPELLKWRNLELNKKSLTNNTRYIPIYWKATDNSILRIKRDSDWFNSIKPILEKEYKSILYYQKDDNFKRLLNSKKNYITGNTITLSDEESCVFSSDNDS